MNKLSTLTVSPMSEQPHPVRTFGSGLQHLQQARLNEGRVLVSPDFDEGLYLLKYPDVAAVKGGVLKSGLQHYIQSG